MKIISKFKDYYDFLQGVWGIDELRVLDRTDFTALMMFPERGVKIKIYVGNFYVEGLSTGKEILYGDQLLPFSKTEEEFRKEKRKWSRWRSWWDREKLPDELYNRVYLDGFDKGYTAQILKEPLELKDPVTRKINCPILIEPNGVTPLLSGAKVEYRGMTLYKNPILKEFNFGSAMYPEKIWLLLSDWLGYQPEIQNNQTDKEKIISAGFDTKTSFRNTK
jgi:hypothetical protein